MKLSDLIRGLDYVCCQGDLEREISTLVYDSGKVERDSVFVCITGAVNDAHEYVGPAVEKGAAAVIVEKEVCVPDDVTVVRVENTRIALAEMSASYFGHPAEQLITVGITGTNGKTTVSHMIRSILEDAGLKTGLIGTMGIFFGDEMISTINTTPESYIIQEAFRKMADAGCKYAVMEVSSQGLMLHHVDGFVFDYGVFTNLEPDHIGPNEHTDLEHYIFCKSLLFRRCRHGIFYADDCHLAEILKDHTCTVETYGCSANADYRANEIHLLTEDRALGIGYHMSGHLDLDVEIAVPGQFNVFNSMAAIVVCHHLSIAPETMRRSLSRIHVKGRVEIVPVSSMFTVMIDYAHNAMSLECVLTTLREYKPKRLICLFGCGGNRSRDRRFQMGEVSSGLADLTIVTSDNPRYENPQSILDDIITGVKKADGEYIAVPDRAEAIRYAIENAKEGDLILLAGKGHEDYQEICGKKYHMDDRELIADVVKDGNFIQ